MAVLTDLTWEQLASKLPDGAINISPNGEVIINASLVTNLPTATLADNGVIKFFSLMLSGANKAQTEVNQSQADGEKLTAFSPATIGTAADGYVNLTRTFNCRSELATATNIIGLNG